MNRGDHSNPNPYPNPNLNPLTLTLTLTLTLNQNKCSSLVDLSKSFILYLFGLNSLRQIQCFNKEIVGVEKEDISVI